ncbi:V-type proton ATPase subunit C 1-B [Neoarius graeffei]|uniref:V-type proton ATPase subunit C 1-B n=1 Tax=Neoarius graeffei TaxID=443677 RepID=UPI00298CE64D|nr:V-type proton ATPase subunit C 1-B [Neoarius graeffei]
MAEFWLISVPLDKVSSQSLEKLKRATVKASLGSYFRFHIPELKVGTLDVLLSVSDDLSRLDSYAEGVMRKTAQCMTELMEQSSDKVMENVLANGEQKAHRKVPQSPLKMYFQALRGIDISVDLTTYMTKFQWDRAKYPIALPLKPLTDLIFKQVAQVETELKSRNAAYSDVKLSLQALEQQREGCLHTRSLTGIVKKEDLVLNSEYLTTLLVVVPRMCIRQWENTYESMSEFVVPRSSRKLLEEEDAGIFTVTLFKNAVKEFKANAKKHKFTVRDFNLEEAEWQQKEMSRLSIDKKEQYGIFVRWLKVNFNEIFVAWIHIKALRVFVESVLRYGLPVSFQALLLQPQKKQVKRLRDELNSVFTHLDPMAVAGKQDVGHDIAEVNIGQQEYYSYIYYPISINIVDSS